MTNHNFAWATDPIAIIGMSCKFAGSASSPGKFWDMLAEGRSAWSEIPSSRFNVKGTHHPDHERIKTTHAKGAHFISEDNGLFDAAFFNFSAELASAIDPQFRLQLESAYEALENAGLPLSRISGSNTSVYTGNFSHDYHEGLIRDEDQLPRFLPIGTFPAMSANRLSHFFDLRGASMTIETGCSSTLVALHEAVRSLRDREADMSVVSGSSLLLTPDMFKTLGSLGMLSPDGKSYAFDSRANGYGRGEGVATIVVKRLNDALACGDPIRALIRETCLNQDGKTETITTPSQTAQEDLIRECYRRAGLDALHTQYVEAHGTGTPTGDPIEARAIAAVFGGLQREEPLLIGSVKTNIGHTEAASGLASLIKVVLAMEKHQIPPSINFKSHNPKLALDEWRLAVVTDLQPWRTTEPNQPRRASVNNFAYGGSNAHIILEEFDLEPLHPKSITNGNTDYENSAVLLLSARDEKACQRMVLNLIGYLRDAETGGRDVAQTIKNLAYTLGERRSIFPWVAVNQVHLQDNSLGTVVQALESPKFTPIRSLSRYPRIGMVFTGQGAQWYAMGRELIDSYPVFKASLEEAGQHLEAIGAEWSPLEELQRDAHTSRVNTTELSIPVCVALQIALVRLLESWAITPTAVTSHSSGEIAAAYTAGVLTLRQAMAIAYYRARLAADTIPRMKEKGGMLAVGVGADEVKVYLDRLQLRSGKAAVACINSPQSVTIAGDVGAVVELEEMCKQESIFARRLRVDTGYHSHHMQPIAVPYLEFLQNQTDFNDYLDDEISEVAFSSPVTGGRMTSVGKIAAPEHWVSSLLQPVRFVEAFTDMVRGGIDKVGGSNIDVIIEVGPHTALAAPIREILSLPEFEGLDLPYLGCLVRNENAGNTMRSTAVNLLREGLPLDMHSINFPRDDSNLQVLTDLPSYPWNHSNKHWQESRMNRSIRARNQEPHDLLGSLIPGVNLDNATWRNILRVSDVPWLGDHRVQDNIVYPGAGYVCQAIEAAKQLLHIQDSTCKKIEGYRLRDVEILTALIVPDNAEGIEVHTTLSQVSDRNIGARGWKKFEVLSVTIDSRYTVHARGLVVADVEGSHGVRVTSRLVERPLSSYRRYIDPEDMFANLRSRGIYHGPKFQNTIKIEQDGREPRSVSHVSIADTTVANDLVRYPVLHPTTLDSVILSAYSALPGVGALENDTKLPQLIQRLWVSSSISYQAEHEFSCHADLVHSDAQKFQANSLVLDIQTGDPVLEMQGLVCQSIGRSLATASDEEENKKDQILCTKIEWAPDISLNLRQPQFLSWMKKELTRPGDEPERELLIRLRRVCIYFCHDAIQNLTTQDISNLEPHHVRFHSWMVDLLTLAASGQLGPKNSTWISDGPQERERQIAMVSKESIDGEMVCRMGSMFLPILRREKIPLEVMMEGGLLKKYYDSAVRVAPSLRRLATILRKVVHKNPRARILEIGGEISGATRHMPSALSTSEKGGPLVESWHFTSTSSKIFEAVCTDFAAWADILEFDTLDIDKDPAAQGFELASYDIAVVCELSHTSKSAARNLANVCKLMKPGATLLLMETTKDQIDMQFTFGLLPGWWPECQSSQTFAMLSRDSRDSFLRGAGFSGIDFEMRDCEDDNMHCVSVIMSTVPIGQPTPKTVFSKSEIVFVISNSAPPPVRMLNTLKANIQALTGGPEPSIISLEDTTDGCDYSEKICLFLGEIMQPILYSMDEVLFQATKAMVTSCQGLLYVTMGGDVECEDPNLSLSRGLLRTLRTEYVGRRYISLDLEAHSEAAEWTSGITSTITKVFESAFTSLHTNDVKDWPIDDFEYAERDGVLLVSRLYKDTMRSKLCAAPHLQESTKFRDEPFLQKNRPLRLEVGTPGLLDTLAFGDYDLATDTPLAPDLVEIEPRAYGVNFRDVMVAMGQLRDRIMGLECSGIIMRLGIEAQKQGFKVGDRVMALLAGPYASRAQTSWHGIVHIPDDMSFEDAASLPMIFSTAYVSLVDIARFRSGQSVLIHSAAGGVGQAAIMLTRYLGAQDIFVTVGSQEKRDFLIREYGIPETNIFKSRDACFAPSIMTATGGRGVDVVLNSLAGPLLQAGFDVVAPFGHFVEIGKKDLESNSLLEMGSFSRVASYTSVDMIQLLKHRGTDVSRVLAKVANLIQKRILAPVHPVTAYPIRDVAKAFRLLQTGRHTGKVILTTGPDEEVKVSPRLRGAVRLREDASYLIVGGVGGIGCSIAYWLAGRGAKKLIILSRSAGNDEKTRMVVEELREIGCQAMAINCDVAIAGDLAKALRACEEHGMPPVRGVIQAAMALQDSVLERMTLDDWRVCIRPKVHGTWNLHVQWSEPDSLDFFIMLSSVVGILGHVSQASYAAGGAYQDAMAHWRQGRGLPGISLDLGAVKGVGYIAKTAGVADRMSKMGATLMLDESTVLRALESAILEPLGHPQIVVGLNTGPGPHWDPQSKSQMSQDARYLPLRYRGGRLQDSGSPNDEAARGSEGQTLAGRLAQVSSHDDATRLVGDSIAAKLASIFLTPVSEVDLEQSPTLCGVDSLVAVELRNMLVSQAGSEVSIFTIMQSPTLTALAQEVAAKSKYMRKD